MHRGLSAAGRWSLAGALSALALLLAVHPARAAEADPSDGCPPMAGLSFLCGLTSAEDMVLIPGTRWVLTSGIGIRDGAGPPGAIRLVDTRTKRWKQAYPTWRQWYPADASNRFNPADVDPACSGPPAPATLQVVGLSIRRRGPGRFWLYAITHPPAGADRIEAFDLDARGAEPTLKWIGCVGFPAAVRANSVASTPDGQLLVTVITLPGRTREEYLKGVATGAVYHWKPGDKAFTVLRGTELAGNNGIDISPDGKTFYVVAFGDKSLVSFALKDPSKPLAKAQFTGFWPDNVHWDDRGRLITAGNNHNYNECLDRPLERTAPEPACTRAWAVAAVDPATMRAVTLASGPTTPLFTNVASGLVVGDEIWIGSYWGTRIAYRPAPSAKKSRTGR